MTANVWISEDKTTFEAAKTNVTFECQKNADGSFYIRVDGYQAETFTMTAEQFAVFKDWIGIEGTKFQVGNKVLINKNAPVFAKDGAETYKQNFDKIGTVTEVSDNSAWPYRVKFPEMEGAGILFSKEELIRA